MHKAHERNQVQTGREPITRNLAEMPGRLDALEADTGSLQRRIERIELAMLGPQAIGRDGGFQTAPTPGVALGFTTITGPRTAAASVNIEEPVTFVVKEFPGGKLLANEPVTFTITNTSTGSIADSKSGTPGRTVVTIGTTLTIDTDTRGEATVFALGTMVESFNVTGLVTGAILQPSHKVVITVT